MNHQNVEVDHVHRDRVSNVNSKPSTHITTEYDPVSGTTVSNPDNLICDYCVNQKMYRKKLENEEDERERDK